MSGECHVIGSGVYILPLCLLAQLLWDPYTVCEVYGFIGLVVVRPPLDRQTQEGTSCSPQGFFQVKSYLLLNIGILVVTVLRQMVEGLFCARNSWPCVSQSREFVAEMRIRAEMKIENRWTKYFLWEKNWQAYFFSMKIKVMDLWMQIEGFHYEF